MRGEIHFTTEGGSPSLKKSLCACEAAKANEKFRPNRWDRLQRSGPVLGRSIVTTTEGLEAWERAPTAGVAAPEDGRTPVFGLSHRLHSSDQSAEMEHLEISRILPALNPSLDNGYAALDISDSNPYKQTHHPIVIRSEKGTT